MASNFQKVVDFNTQFGVLKSSELKPKPDILTQDPDTVQHCLKLIREEMGELEKAVVDLDFIEVVDALADILYVVYGAGSRFGIDMDRVLNIVHDNNMTKLCKTEDEAKRSVENYVQCRKKLLEIESVLTVQKEYKCKSEEYYYLQAELDKNFEIFKKSLKEIKDSALDNELELKVESIDNNGHVIGKQVEQVFANIRSQNKFCEESKPKLEKFNAMSQICRENLEFCKKNKSFVDLDIDMEFYEKNKYQLGYDTPSYRKAPDGIHWVVYNQSTNKVLKSIEYKPVDLSNVCK